MKGLIFFCAQFNEVVVVILLSAVGFFSLEIKENLFCFCEVKRLRLLIVFYQVAAI